MKIGMDRNPGVLDYHCQCYWRFDTEKASLSCLLNRICQSTGKTTLKLHYCHFADCCHGNGNDVCGLIGTLAQRALWI